MSALPVAKCNASSYPPRSSSFPPPKVFTIGVSGCSSSGKTILAFLLQEIFSSIAKNPHSAQVSLDDFLKGKAANTEKISPILIHEDAYFKDKSYCPNATFVSTPADVDIIQRTIRDEDFTQYIVVLNDNQPCGSYSADGTVEYVTHRAPSWCVTGPDTDCWSALDIPSLAAAIQYVRKTGSLSDAYRRLEQATHEAIPGLLVTPEQRAEILEAYADLIAAMKEQVEIWFKCQAAIHAKPSFNAQRYEAPSLPTLCIIEGFLLYPDPINAHTSPDIGSSSTKENTPFSTPGLNSSDSFVPRDPKRNSSYLINEARKDAFQANNVKARSNITQEFDIKLFLPSSKQQARHRRFVRECYVDEPLGNRQPGQLWKTEGYFNDIVWGNYTKEQDWLFQDRLVDGPDVQMFESGATNWCGYPDCDDAQVSSKVARNQNEFKRDGQVSESAVKSQNVFPSQAAQEAGVHIRPVIDASVEDTVEWAVRITLEGLKDRAWLLDSEMDDAVGEETNVFKVYSDQDSGINLDAGIERKKSVWKSCFCF